MRVRMPWRILCHGSALRPTRPDGSAGQHSTGDRLMARFQSAALAAAALIGLGGVGAPAFAADVNVDNVQLPYWETLNLKGYIDGSSYSDNGQLAGQIVLTANDIGSPNLYTLSVWCVDIFHDIALGGSGYRY